jgi:hypothetical protein
LPDFDPGALETLLALAVASNNRDLWAIIPKQGRLHRAHSTGHLRRRARHPDGKPIVVHHLSPPSPALSTDLFSGPENQLLQAELPQQGFALSARASS